MKAKRGRGDVAVTFKEVLAQVIAWLQPNGRVSYRALKRQFDLDDDCLDDLKVALIKAKKLARDEDGEVLVWIGASPTLTQNPRPETYAEIPCSLRRAPPVRVPVPMPMDAPMQGRHGGRSLLSWGITAEAHQGRRR